MTQAIIYIRFSDRRQEKGDSHERQLRDCTAYCERKGWEVGTPVQDLGKSAWKVENHLTSGNLGRFGQSVNDGLVPHGTLLVVEKLDRLSRQEPLDTLDWMRAMCRAGLRIATVDGDKIYDDERIRTDLMSIFEILMKAKLAHDESKQKSERVSSSKVLSFERAQRREGQWVITAKTPGWLKAKPTRDGFDEIEERVQIVNEIYEMSAAGTGAPGIAKVLNDKAVTDPAYAAWGKWRLEHSTPTWDTTQVKMILHHPAVEGDYVVGAASMKKVGPKLQGKIVGYFGEGIVDAELVARARAGVQARKITRGHHQGVGIANLFAGALRCAECGSVCHIGWNGRTEITKRRYARCAAAVRGRGCGNKRLFNYTDFESAALDCILHLALDDRFFTIEGAVSKLNVELAEVTKSLADKQQQSDRARHGYAATGEEGFLRDVTDLKAAIETLKARKAELQEAIGVAKGQVSDIEHLARVTDLRDALNSSDMKVRKDARLKVQAAIRGIVQSVELQPDDCFPYDEDERHNVISPPQRTMTMILKAHAMAIKFDNKGQLLKGVDGNLKAFGFDDSATAIMGGDQVADLLHRMKLDSPDGHRP